ncbi:AsnC family transcriptional regulator [Burkholderia pyrrocinia]|uniref:Lrp/AsnC family transcriptional regulator n=1 Tax=Burkholderia stagnalis TaxID=1503054 RepID=UPI00075A3758|nr:Lrp/AsnC family transcriptional regulator [Burkholderia stagnalis]KVN41749.1 AsnC family transcriptional regulator [Burkholderia pyrrocinia]WGS46773.1 Lrp/AsnC family transcriptional regulator [Burkholderia sp. JSH-S8]
MDALDWKILDEVQQAGRVSQTDLARKVGLSIPTTAERLKKLEDAGVIEAFVARVNAKKAGYEIMALIGITTGQPQKSRLLKQLESMPEVIECLHVTGDDSYMMKVVASDIPQLEALIAKINVFGETRTSIVLSHSIPPRPIRRPQAGERGRR